jgi:hypothetical protein
VSVHDAFSLVGAPVRSTRREAPFYPLDALEGHGAAVAPQHAPPPEPAPTAPEPRTGPGLLNPFAPPVAPMYVPSTDSATHLEVSP